MNLMEKLETRFDKQIVFPDELAREAASEIKKLREALRGINLECPTCVRYSYENKELIDEALMQSPDVRKGSDNG